MWGLDNPSLIPQLSPSDTFLNVQEASRHQYETNTIPVDTLTKNRNCWCLSEWKQLTDHLTCQMFRHPRTLPFGDVNVGSPQETNSLTEQSLCSQVCDASVGPLSPLTSIENMPKTLCFVLDRSSELLFSPCLICFLFCLICHRQCGRSTLPQLHTFQCRVSFVVSFYRSEPMGQQCSDSPDVARSVCLASLPAGPERFSFRLHTVQALCCQLMHKHQQMLSVHQEKCL